MKNNVVRMCLVCVCFFLSACATFQEGSPRERERMKEVLAPQLEKEFQKKGYEGRVTVTDYRNQFAVGADVFYRYEEKVDGRLLVFEDSVGVDEETEQLDLEGQSTIEGIDDGVDIAIIREAMWQQPYVLSQFEMMEKAIGRLTSQDLVLLDIQGDFLQSKSSNDDELDYSLVREAHKCLLADVEGNRNKGLPLNGYYHVDVPKYLKEHVLQMELSILIEVEEGFDFDSSEARLKLEEAMQELMSMDYSQFWPGYYIVEFHRSHTREWFIREGKNVLVLDIRDGKLVRSFHPW